MHLFMSFIMRAIAVFIKDVILFESGESEHCFVSSVSTRAHRSFHLTLLNNAPKITLQMRVRQYFGKMSIFFLIV